MRLVPEFVARLAAPYRVPVRGTEVRDHDCDRLAGARAIALSAGGDGTDVSELEAFATAAAAPARRAAVEEVLRAGGRVDVCARGGLPGGHGGTSGAAAGAGLAVVVVLGGVLV